MQCAGVRLSHLGMVGSHKVEVAGATHAVSGRLSKQLVSQGGGALCTSPIVKSPH